MFDIDINKITESKTPNEGTFLQTPFWCEFKTSHGWQYNRFDVNVKLSKSYIESLKAEGCEKSTFTNEDYNKSFELAVLNRSFLKGLFSIAYIPLMPELPFECTSEEVINAAMADDGETVAVVNQEFVTPETQTIEFAFLLSELSKALKPLLPKNTMVIRFDPEVTFTNLEDRDLFNYGLKTVAWADKLKLKKNKVDIQPPDSTLVSLEGTEDEILARMHQKWRYNIRLSERKGVIIKKYNGDSAEISSKIDKFYELTKETNARDGNASHAKSYYRDLILSSAKQLKEGKDVPEVNLYIAEHEGDEIASIVTLFSKTESVYLYGASSNNKRNLMPNHLLQWTAMKDAKAYGSKYYDMYGMPPEGKDENHPMHGLYMFKANFGGKNIHRTGSWDVPLNAVYYGYSWAEKLRAFWHKKVIKKIKGR
ncbi:MAG: peptidoglycan bridge formation glycyltransferase FemA/FemB family protein [Treponema sp.]|nr:peptidoglycan bridge formation glycyltransferase FemA/FemB family protein [Spirochaetia bacterium]MDD7768563.1 peptidoglycan bridge formation glycyltransferase FemA/FemB family protein [Treponema sp.]MDY3131841.1 peptidoglycan bridge formation glycyltransferase FemA/FemB family protein [Treponema sp.]